jgi:lipopolysaccharide transport system ATP-binding protein
MKEKISKNQTVVLVSHQPNTTTQICDRAIVLQMGRIIFIGDVNEAQKVYWEISSMPENSPNSNAG